MLIPAAGGMDSIPKAIAAAVGKEKILLRSKVTKITDLADGVEVEYQDRNGRTMKIKADFCVAAMPPHILAKTPHNLGPDVQAALSMPTVTSSGKIDLEQRRRSLQARAQAPTRALAYPQDRHRSP
jgi:monoamine oxidase